MPEAHPHDPEVLPHQHENINELFPWAFVSQPAGEDGLASEPDPFKSEAQRSAEEMGHLRKRKLRRSLFCVC